MSHEDIRPLLCPYGIQGFSRIEWSEVSLVSYEAIRQDSVFLLQLCISDVVSLCPRAAEGAKGSAVRRLIQDADGFRTS